MGAIVWGGKALQWLVVVEELCLEFLKFRHERLNSWILSGIGGKIVGIQRSTFRSGVTKSRELTFEIWQLSTAKIVSLAIDGSTGRMGPLFAWRRKW